MTDKDIIISDACGQKNYDDPDHRRDPGKQDSPPKGTGTIFAEGEQAIFLIETDSPIEITDIGDGEKISNGEGATIRAYDKIIAENKEPESK